MFTLRGLVSYYVLFFIHLESRRVEIAGITLHPNDRWMKQIARNVSMDGWGFLGSCRYLIMTGIRNSRIRSRHRQIECCRATEACSPESKLECLR